MAEKKEYKEAVLETIGATPEAIISGSLNDEIKSRMLAVIETEAPIKESLLFKRVINSLSLKKVGSRILPVFDSISSSLPVRITEDSDGERVFHKETEDDCYRPTPDSAVRYSYQIPEEEAYQIPEEEAAACLRAILEKHGKTMTKKELKKIFRDEMGYQKMGASVDNLFNAAAKHDGIKRTGNGRFTV